jgi:hypothetical protein
MNRYDKEFFQREIQEFPAVEPAPVAKLTSHHAIRAARDFFRKTFETKYTELGRGEPAYRWALRIQDVLTNHVSLVAVRSADEDNASSVFETLNDRGIGLSTPDLLRTLLLRRANTDAERDEIINLWETILAIEDEASAQSFLRHYWLSEYGDIKTHALYREIKQHIEAKNVESLGFSVVVPFGVHRLGVPLLCSCLVLSMASGQWQSEPLASFRGLWSPAFGLRVPLVDTSFWRTSSPAGQPPSHMPGFLGL